MKTSLIRLSLSLAWLPAAGSALAQTDGGGWEPETLDMVVVTATKQSTPAFETPASVSVLGGEAVERQNLQSLTDVAQRVPNVYFTDFTNSTPTITIRGLGFSDDESDSTSTSVLLDGVPIYGLTLGTLADLAQIEVLRGPQSVLYGQNSMGGLIAMRTRDPKFAWGGTAQLDYGTDARRRLGVGVDVPLGDDTAVRVSAGGEDGDGYVENVALDRDDTTGWRSRYGHLKFLHRDASGGEWRFGAHYVKRDGGNDFFAPVALAHEHRSNASDAGINDTDYTLFTGQYDRRFDSGTQLAVIAGGGTAHWSYWMPATFFGAPAGFDSRTRQYSAEVRLSSPPTAGGAIDWLAGVYGSKLDKDAPYLFEIPGFMRSSTVAKIDGSTAAAFGEVGWRFAPQWRLAAALRFEHDRRSMDWLSDQSGYFDGDGDGMPDTPYAMTDTLSNVKADDNVWLPRLTLEYRPDAQQFLWTTLARGYKASGFNQYAFDPVSASIPYAPEYGNYAELGYRLRAVDSRWELTAVAFYTRLRDQQVVVIGDGGESQVTNAGRSHNQGVELTALVRPVRSLEVSAFVGYVEAEYDEYINGGVDYAGEQFPNTPRQSYGLALNWQPAAGWETGLSVRRLGRSNLYPISTVRNDAYTLLDADLSYRFGGWTLGLYGKNLSDARYYSRALDATTVVAAPPCTVGARAAFSF